MKKDIFNYKYAIFLNDGDEYGFVDFTNNKEPEDPIYTVIEIDNTRTEYDYFRGISTAIYDKSVNKAYVYTDMEIVKLFRNNENRQTRNILLSSFDLWEKAVVRR